MTTDIAMTIPDTAPEEAVEFLRSTAAYPMYDGPVEVIETHISHVFLTNDLVYKLKKPVRYDFVDFSTVAARRRACEAEVRLNRRLARDVYLGVAPLRRDSYGALSFHGPGKVVDWVVKMRRLPQDRMLDRMIRCGAVTHEDVERLAALLADFYEAAPPLTLQPVAYRRDLESHVFANRAELLRPSREIPPALVRKVHTAQWLFLELHADGLDARVCDGRIIDGHGDLRPEHVCLRSPPVVFDCLEFSEELRRLDVLDEIGFFAMECDLLGAPHVGARVLEVYRDRCRDQASDDLLAFYKTYRACVRAKVAALRSDQLEGRARDEARTDARRYLELAQRYANNLAGPLVLIVRGLTGTGKSTLARNLAERLGMTRLSTDDIRREMHGPSSQPSAYGAGVYADDARAQVYEELLKRARERLAAGESVVLDGTFLKRTTLAQAQALAGRGGATPLVVTCECAAEVARERVATRLAEGEDTSEARQEFLALQRDEIEAAPEDLRHMEVDTASGSALPPEAVLQWLKSCLDGPSSG